MKTVGLIVIALGVFLFFVANRPDTFRLQRSLSIKASPEKVFALLNDFHQWGAWSPWEKLDPAMTRTFSGANSGVGAIYEWHGNKKVGKGRMEIIESSPSHLLRIKLDFLAPFEAHNTAEFTLQPQADGTNITWAMYGPSPFISKLMTMFFSMDKMVGGDFERGLTNLKQLAE
ncbi:MAG: SRPBCC family protein [Steroidobacteraceae bacterium]